METLRRRFQFRLRTLMIGVFAFSFALAAMRFATSAWANAVVSVTMFALLFSLVLAVYRRPFWVGFAICGIGYLALDQIPFASEFVDSLITRRSIASLREMLHPQADYFPQGWMEANLKGEGWALHFNQRDVSNGNDHWQEMARSFRLIVTCLWILIFATLGGKLAQFAAGRSRGQAALESRDFVPH